MSTMIVQHAVADYGVWRTAYDSGAPLRARHNCTADRVLRSTNGDGETLTVLHDFTTEDDARAFAADPDLASLMTRAGVVGPPTITFAAEG